MPVNAALAIEAVLRNDRTALKQLFCTQPFKVANVTEDKTQQKLALMLMSSSPGVLDGDVYAMSLALGEGCRLSLETQAYQRLFQMQTGASQQLRVQMAKNSFFSYLPHPVVPHRASAFAATNHIFMEENCTLLWGEVLSCGRMLNGEVFQFSSYHSCTSIYLKNKLVVKENLLLRPQQVSTSTLGQMEEFTHQATLLYLDEHVDVKHLADAAAAMLEQQPQVAFGASALPVNGLVVRLLGYKAEQLFQFIKKLAGLFENERHHLATTRKETHVT